MKVLIVHYLKQVVRTPYTYVLMVLLIFLVPAYGYFFTEMTAAMIAVLMICGTAPLYVVSMHVREELYLGLPFTRLEIFLSRFVASLALPVFALLAAFGLIAPWLRETPLSTSLVILVNLVCGLIALQATMFVLLNVRRSGIGEISPFWFFFGGLPGIALVGLLFAGCTFLPALLLVPYSTGMLWLGYRIRLSRELIPAHTTGTRRVHGRELGGIGAYPSAFMLGTRFYWRGVLRSPLGIPAVALGLMAVVINQWIILFVSMNFLLQSAGSTAPFFFSCRYDKRRLFAAAHLPIACFLGLFTAFTVFMSPYGGFLALAFRGFSTSRAAESKCTVKYHHAFRPLSGSEPPTVVDPHGYRRRLSLAIKEGENDMLYDPYESNENDPPTFVAYQAGKCLKDMYGLRAEEKEILSLRPPLPGREVLLYGDNPDLKQWERERQYREWIKKIDEAFRWRMAAGLRKRALVGGLALVTGFFAFVITICSVWKIFFNNRRMGTTVGRFLGIGLLVGVIALLFLGMGIPGGFLRAPALQLADCAWENRTVALPLWLVCTAAFYLSAQRLFNRIDVNIFKVQNRRR